MITTILICVLCILVGVYLGRMFHKRQQRKGKVCVSRGRLPDFTPIRRLLDSREERRKRMDNKIDRGDEGGR